MFLIEAVLTDPSASVEERQKALSRIFSDPGVPSKQSTAPFWLRDPHALSKCQSSTLPTEADVVIIGSGVTGASIARTLLQDRTDGSGSSGHPAVVMLEARDVCSGATGRNGGHILETGEEFMEFVETVGVDNAKKIMKFRLAHLKEMLGAAERFGLTTECQARRVQFLSVYFDERRWKEGLASITKFKEIMPEEAAEWATFERGEIPQEFCLPNARGVIAGPAGALWPYRFVSGVLSQLREQFPSDCHIETNTPVTAIRKTGTRFSVDTIRGTIQARHVVHSTNAHVGHLVPGLRGPIFPIRGQMSAQTPGDKFSNQGSKHSWMFHYERGFDYLTQLPRSPISEGQMMLGGGLAQSEGRGIADLGVATDSSLSVYIDIHLSGALSAVFGRENWGPVSGQSVQSMWTGNMAFSSDGFPWVGKLPSSVTGRGSDTEGASGAEWVSAAFCGEGMVHAWLCGKALGIMLLSKEGRLAPSQSADLSWVPELMLVSEERVRKAALPRMVDDLTKEMSRL